LLARLEGRHRASLADLLGRTREFNADDVEVALELIDLGIKREDSYRFWVDQDDERPDVARGYICFGKTPMTRATYDLYWIVVDPACKGKGVGRRLVAKMEDEIRGDGARLVRVETGGTDEYAATRAFYDALGYEILARIREFYWAGNDLFIYGRYLEAAPPRAIM